MKWWRTENRDIYYYILKTCLFVFVILVGKTTKTIEHIPEYIVRNQMYISYVWMSCSKGSPQLISMTLPYPETAYRFNHISAFYTRTLPSGGGWFTVSCDVHQCGAWKWENLRLCMRLGEGMENPHSAVYLPASAVRGGVVGARAPWERCWVCVRVSQRACAVPMPPPPPLPSFVLPLTLCCLV